MLRNLGIALLLAFECSAVGITADVTGRWEGKVAGPQGDFDLVFTFTVDGNKLGGTVEGPGGTLQITNGTIKDDAVAFEVKLETGDAITYQGTVKGDEMPLKVHGPWGDSDFTLKRAPKKG